MARSRLRRRDCISPQRLLDALDAAGVGQVTLTLHVGAGTFLPVKVDDTAQHKMHAESGQPSTKRRRRAAQRDAGGWAVS